MTTLEWGSATHVGKRPNNEDALLVASPLFAVADGMGGHRGGEVASETAVAALRDAFEGKTTADDLAEAVRAANRAVWDRAEGERDLRGMGTTLTAVAVVRGEDGNDELAVANVGDSRAYLLRDGELQQLTNDHNVPGELLARGEITAAQAAAHPQKNLITRVVGADSDVEVDLWQIVPYEGDRVVLASDGLAGEVPDDEIASVLRRVDDPQQAADELVELARSAGGSDNITVVVVDVVDDDGRAVAASEALAGQPRPTARGRADDDVLPSPADGVDGDERVDTAMATTETPAVGSSPRSSSLTGRVVAFVVVLVLLLGAGFGLLTWYGRASYHVGFEGDRVSIFRGRPGGFLWMEPSLAETTRLTADDVLPSRRDDLREGKPEPSLAAARRYVDNLAEEAARTTTTTTTTSSTTTSSAPPMMPPPTPQPSGP